VGNAPRPHIFPKHHIASPPSNHHQFQLLPKHEEYGIFPKRLLTAFHKYNSKDTSSITSREHSFRENCEQARNDIEFSGSGLNRLGRSTLNSKSHLHHKHSVETETLNVSTNSFKQRRVSRSHDFQREPLADKTRKFKLKIHTFSGTCAIACANHHFRSRPRSIMQGSSIRHSSVEPPEFT